jgi:hypothetical protein
MKKSELKQMIKEELLKEAKQKWAVKDTNNTVLRVTKVDTSYFEITQDNNNCSILVKSKDIPLFITAFEKLKKKLEK